MLQPSTVELNHVYLPGARRCCGRVKREFKESKLEAGQLDRLRRTAGMLGLIHAPGHDYVEEPILCPSQIDGEQTPVALSRTR
jgi:hypothetical protein